MAIKSTESIVNDVNTAFEYELAQWKDLRETSEDNYNYVRGNQWVRAEREKAELERLGVPVLNLNLILPVVTLIVGYQINHRYDLKAYPIKDTPQDLAEIVTQIIKYTHIRSNLLHHLSMATLDALIANIGGYLAIEWSNDDDPLGEFKVFRESPFYHLRDSHNEYYDINKGRYHIRTKWLDKTMLLNTFPEHKKDIDRFISYKQKKAGFVDFVSDMWSKVTGKKEPTKLDYVNDKDGFYRVVEFWYFDEQQKRVLINLNNPQNIIELPDAKTEKIAKDLIKGRTSMWDITTLKTKVLKVKTVLGGAEVLVEDEPYDIQIGKFPFINMFTFWLDGEPLSNVENLKDYQDEHNKRSSNILHILNSTANSGWWVRQLSDGKLAVDFENLVVNGHKIGFVGKFKGSRPPEKIEPNKLPSGHVYLDQQTRQGIKETSLIGENIRGQMESANESGRLFNQRVQQAEIALEPFLENMRYSVRLLGDYEVKAIPKKFSVPRILEIVNDENTTVEQLKINTDMANDITKGKYSVKLDEVNASPTARTQKFMEMVGMAQMMPPELVYWPTILRQSPYEGKEELAAYAEKMMGQAQQQQAEAGELMKAKQMAEIQDKIQNQAIDETIE